MITPNSELVLNFLKKNFGQEFTKNEIAETLGISIPAVTGSINGLVKKGYVTERLEEKEVEQATETRKAKVKIVRHETLTEAGLAYDPVAEEEAKQAAKAAEKERKAAERAAAKAAKEANA
jgi:DNA-binding MarR family transcriptional regulator